MKTTLRFEALDDRTVPSITLADGVVTVAGDSTNDAVTVTRDTRGTTSIADDTILVERGYGGTGDPNTQFPPHYESRAFNLYSWSGGFTALTPAVKKIEANLRSGVNRFENATSVPCEVWGGSAADNIKGGSGADRLHGLGGHDKLYGNGGDDELFAGAGDDDLYGGPGVDTLVSTDTGSDDLYGGDALSGHAALDSYWKDPLDTIRTPSLVSSRRIHTVSAFEPLTAGESSQSPGRTPLGESLLDPLPQPEDEATREDFSGNRLFPKAGPKFDDIDQGALGDCFFLARLAATAHRHPDYVRDLVVDLGDDTYAVQFLGANNARKFVRVDAELYVRSPGDPTYAGLAADDALWVAIVEKAYAFFRNGEGTYESIDGGSKPQVSAGTSAALGLAEVSNPAANGAELRDALRAAAQAGQALVLGGPAGWSNDTVPTEANKGAAPHIYALHSFDTEPVTNKPRVWMYDPHGDGPDDLRAFTNFDMMLHCSGGAGKTVAPPQL